MAWSTSNRRSRLPKNWQALRHRVMKRDGHRCTAAITLPDGSRRRCPDAATDVDHVIAGDNHALDNLRAICRWHHDRKSAQEGQAALAVKREEISQRFRRAP